MDIRETHRMNLSRVIGLSIASLVASDSICEYNAVPL